MSLNFKIIKYGDSDMLYGFLQSFKDLNLTYGWEFTGFTYLRI